MKVSRKFNWLSSFNNLNRSKIAILEEQLASFYATNPDYYGNIDFTAANWVDQQEKGYQDILETSKKSKKICELGCGNANILFHFPELEPIYTGCDFSPELINRNKKKFPRAEFKVITTPNELPFENEQFDFVFSVFVIEHSTNPAALLDESRRILQQNGRLIILCPDFLGRGRFSSQRSGFSKGTTSDKIKRRKYLDALVTLFDNRVRVPIYCLMLKSIIIRRKRFLINITPTVFTDIFTPDVDAVYLTYKWEMIKFLNPHFSIIQNNKDIKFYTAEKKLIYLKASKNI